ncbi:hypothetical protein HPB51_014816 [Rhipicephalus microplus]|uniref:HTH psq-type domain-containing protein n=1 Tax=Rhipicephalus microplus TaxID=6941 RepID=A0A9J6DN35_RHIMP|nr:hypothetical protein HPB51_014816 [Rhipicephalus microplus]
MAPPSVPSREPSGVKKRGKYTTLTMEKKAAIIKLIESGRSQLDVAKEYHLSKQTVSDYVKNCIKILTAFENSHNKSQKNDSKGVHPALEEALQLWLKGVLAKNLPVLGDLLKEKAESRTVLCLDNGKAYKVDILAAIHMLAEAWKAVKPDNIAHCFRHAGFAAAEEPEANDPDVSDPDGTDGGEDLMRDLRSLGLNLPATMTFKDFTRADDDIVSCAEATDDEILRQVVPEPESGSDDDNDDRPQPSAAEIANAVTILLSVYGDDVTLARIRANQIASKRSLRQGSIKDFFKPA